MGFFSRRNESERTYKTGLITVSDAEARVDGGNPVRVVRGSDASDDR